MGFLHFIKNGLLHIAYGIIVVLIISCSKLPGTFVNTKCEKQIAPGLFRSKQSKIASVDKYGCIKLHWAVINVNKEAVEKILSLPIDQLKKIINRKDKRGYTALQWCVDYNILDQLDTASEKEDYLYILKCLLNNPNCNVAILDNHHRSILHWVVINTYVEGCRAVFDRLMASGTDKAKKLINQRDRFGYPALHYLSLDASEAYSPSHLAILRQFLDNDLYDINVKDADGFPVLYWLVEYNQSKLAQEILTSEKLETFAQIISKFIRKELNEYYSSKRIDIDRLLWEKEVSDSVMEMLRPYVRVLTRADQADPGIKNARKILLERYFCLDQHNQSIKLGILMATKNNLIKKSFNEQNDLISESDEDVLYKIDILLIIGNIINKQLTKARR